MRILSTLVTCWLLGSGCGGDTGDSGGSSRPKSCNVSGTVHAHGSSFPSPDGCNTCSCENGMVGCTAIGCLDSCGGITGKPCAAGNYCVYPAGCGNADQAGYCMPEPDSCPEIYAPVCGCDGKTYGNACSAAAAGVSVAGEGECAAPTGRPCGARLGNTCSANQYCAYENGDCGHADGTSVCKTRPQACDSISDPVCGCDGKTYGNACDAASAGVGWLQKGGC